MKNVVSIVLNNFKNDSRVLKEAITLQNNGYNVTVVALHDNGLDQFEKNQFFKVHRIKLISRKWSKIQIIKLLKYIEFSIRFIKHYRNIDIIHCNDLGPLPISVFIKKFVNRKIKVVYDAHEYETEVGLRGFRKLITEILEKVLIKHVDKVLTVSDGIAEEYVKKYDISKPDLVLNCPPYQGVQKKNKFREKFDIHDNQKIFLYQGGLTTGRGLELILETFKTLNNKDAVLVVMGYGILENLVKEYANKYENIFFHEAVPPNVLLHYTSSADVGICLIENSCLSHYYCLPNKFFEYAMVGLPILSSNLFELNRLTSKYQCGWTVDYEVEKIQEKITEILNVDFSKYSMNAKEMSKKYCWENQEKVLLDVYREVCL